MISLCLLTAFGHQAPLYHHDSITVHAHHARRHSPPSRAIYGIFKPSALSSTAAPPLIECDSTFICNRVDLMPQWLVPATTYMTAHALTNRVHHTSSYLWCGCARSAIWRKQVARVSQIQIKSSTSYSILSAGIISSYTIDRYILDNHWLARSHNNAAVSFITVSLLQITGDCTTMLPTTTYNVALSDSKDSTQLRANMLHVAGFRGTANDMLAQLHHFQAIYRVPLAHGAELMVEEAASQQLANTGHAIAGAVLSTHTKRSILLPLAHECIFSANPDTAGIFVDELETVYPLRMQAALPAPPGHHGRMPTLLAQPWLVDPEAELHLISRLYGFNALHRHCADDIYLACMLRLNDSFQRFGHPDGIRSVQLLWHSPAVAQPAVSARTEQRGHPQKHDPKLQRKVYPLTLYVYLVAGAMLNPYEVMARAALPPQESGYHYLDFYPCLQLISPTASIPYATLQLRVPDTAPWLLLVDTRRTPLGYVHRMLLAMGIPGNVIFGMANTTYCGRYKEDLQHSTNILIHITSQQVLDRLADRWFLDTATQRINVNTHVTTQRSDRVRRVQHSAPLQLADSFPILQTFCLQQAMGTATPPMPASTSDVSQIHKATQQQDRFDERTSNVPKRRHDDMMELDARATSAMIPSAVNDPSPLAPPSSATCSMGATLQRELEECVQRVLAYNEEEGLRLLLTLYSHHNWCRQQRLTTADIQRVATADHAQRAPVATLLSASSTDHGSPNNAQGSSEDDMMLNRTGMGAALRHLGSPRPSPLPPATVPSLPFLLRDWLSTMGGGVCGYAAIAQGYRYCLAQQLSAQASSFSHSELVSFLVQLMTHAGISAGLQIKLNHVLMWLNNTGVKHPLPAAHWCSVRDILEMAHLAGITLQLWLGTHYMHGKLASVSDDVHLYRTVHGDSPAIHVALFAHHFYYMRSMSGYLHASLATDGPALTLATQMDSGASHLDTICASTMPYSSLDNLSCIGGSHQSALAAVVTTAHPNLKLIPAISQAVQHHTLKQAEEMNWDGLGTLVRLIMHEIPPRPETESARLSANTKTQVRQILQILLRDLPSSSACSALRIRLAQMNNDTPSSHSHCYPTNSPLLYHDLLLAATALSLPLTFWFVPTPATPPTTHYPCLFDCSPTVCDVPWHYVQHVLVTTTSLLRLEQDTPLTAIIAQRLQTLVAQHPRTYPPARVVHNPSVPQHSLVTRYHFYQRANGMLPVLPLLYEEPLPQRTTRPNATTSTTTQIPECLRSSLFRCTSFLPCNHLILSSCYITRSMLDATSVFASTIITVGTRIAPYVGVVSSADADSREYTALTTDGPADVIHCPSDYGYHFFGPPSTVAPPNIARYVNSPRLKQRDALEFNTTLTLSSSRYKTLWLTALRDILPHEELLCDHGHDYPQHIAALPASSITRTSGASQLSTTTQTSTQTLVDTDRNEPSISSKRLRLFAPPVSQSTISLTDLWTEYDLDTVPTSKWNIHGLLVHDDAPHTASSHPIAQTSVTPSCGDVNELSLPCSTKATLHEVHLHPAGPERSSDCGGDGPSPSISAIIARCTAMMQDTNLLCSIPCLTELVTLDIAADMLRHLASCPTTYGQMIAAPTLLRLLHSAPSIVLAQPWKQAHYQRTQALGYCGYIVILQSLVMYVTGMLCKPNLMCKRWRQILADLLEIVADSPAPSAQPAKDEFRTLCTHLSTVIPRLRSGTTDNGTLDSLYWLSGDEVLTALCILQIPSSLWIHRDSLSIYPHLPADSLILMQATAQLQLPSPNQRLNQLSSLLMGIHIGFSGSHFFPINNYDNAIEPARALTDQLIRRWCSTPLDQILWLESLLMPPDPSHVVIDLLDSTSPPRNITPQCSTSSISDASADQLANSPVQTYSSSAHPLGTLSSTPLCHSPPITSNVSKATPHTTASKRRKHRRRARRDAFAIQQSPSSASLLGTTPAVAPSPRNLTVAYWNTNGHLTQHSMHIISKMITHLSLDVCVLLDTRLNATAGDYHSAAIKHFLPGSAVSLHSTSRYSTLRAGGARMQSMGGAMYILSPRCAPHLRDSRQDPSGLGTVGYISIALPTAHYRFYHCYIPPPSTSHDGPATINQRLTRYLATTTRTETPRTYALSLLKHWITTARKHDTRVMVGGDFNLDPTKQSGVMLRDWAADLALSSLHAHISDTSRNTHMLNGIPRTCIDHIYADVAVVEQLNTSAVLHHPLLAVYSDHCPIYASIHCPDFVPTAPPPAHPPPTRRLELPRHNPDALSAYRNALSTWCDLHYDNSEPSTPARAATLLGALMGATTDAVATVTKESRLLQQRIARRSRFKDGFSPLFVAIRQALLHLLTLQRDLHIMRRHDMPASSLVPHAAFIRASLDWRKRYHPSLFPEQQHTTLQRVDTLLATVRLDSPSVCTIIECMKTLRSMMHGRYRTEWRIQTSARLAYLEDLRATHRIKRMLQHIGIKQRTNLSLHTLTTPECVLSSPRDIHHALTTHFEQWYAAPLHMHTFAQRLSNPTWIEQLLTGSAPLDDTMPATFCQQAFLDACATRLTAEQQHLAVDAISAPLCWEEYQDEIELLAHGKAPGPSGVTATMIKSWPSVVHKLVFDCLACIWKHRSSPQWWLHSYLHPIPKKGAPTLENLRPLGLYEITRKILAAIIIKRSYRQWEDLNLLHPNQHAYRRGMGTGTAILRLLNLVEDSDEQLHPLYLTAWDIRRAFDSIPHPFIRLALRRLGMPNDVVEWYLHLLLHNVVTVQSPHALGAQPMFASSPRTFTDTPHFSPYVLSFHQQQGIGQGDTPSAIFWIALYDILLVMLDIPLSPSSGHYIARSASGFSYAAGSISYADDLCTPAGTFEHNQLQANLVSTFCAATTLAIAMPKVLAFVSHANPPSPLLLHDWNWDAHPILFSTTGIAMTYLGLPSSHRTGDSSARTDNIATLRASTTILATRIASVACKLDVILMQLYPKILYPATKACWSLSEYRALDRPLAAALRRAHHLLPTTAHDMLFFPPSHCGNGHHKLSDLAQTQKWGELQRALQQLGEARWAASGLLERAFRQTELLAAPCNLRRSAAHNLQHLKCYVGSLMEWGAEVDCALTVTPAAPFSAANAPITPHLHPIDHAMLLAELQDRDMTAQGELCTRNRDGHLRWHTDTFTSMLRSALHNNAIALPADDQMHLAAGQMYYLADSARYIEFHSVLYNTSPPVLLVREWHAVTSNPRILDFPLLPAAPLQHLHYQSVAHLRWQRLTTVPASPQPRAQAHYSQLSLHLTHPSTST